MWSVALYFLWNLSAAGNWRLFMMGGSPRIQLSNLIVFGSSWILLLVTSKHITKLNFSSSSDSSGRAKSEDDTKKRGQRSASRLNDRVTWRRIRDEDVPQILKSTLPANALPLVPSPDGEKPKPLALPGKLPTILLANASNTFLCWMNFRVLLPWSSVFF